MLRSPEAMRAAKAMSLQPTTSRASVTPSVYALTVTQRPIEEVGDSAAQLASRLAETIGGPELTLQAGLDLELEPGLSVGPYVSASVGQYLTDSFECDALTCPTGSSIDGSATHAWLGLGVRGSYAP